jgi:hypothetical protein
MVSGIPRTERVFMHGRVVAVLLSSLAFCAALPATALGAPPPNDLFLDAVTLPVPGATGEVRRGGTTVEAGVEPGEPDLGVADAHSVWYRITTPQDMEDMVLVLTVCMPQNAWAEVTVYEGSTVDTLAAVPLQQQSTFASVPPDCTGDRTSFRPVTFGVTAGERYYLRVSGVPDPGKEPSGPFTLYAERDKDVADPNDSFAAAAPIAWPGPTGEVTVAGDTRRATVEAGEPTTADPTSGASVWYTLEALQSEPIVLNTCGGPADVRSVLSVYTGATLTGLTEVRRNVRSDACPSGPNASEVGFLAEAGTTYHVRVAGAYYFMDNSERPFTLRAFRGLATPSVEQLFVPDSWSAGDFVAFNPSITPIDFALASATPASFRCSLDGAAPSACPASIGYAAELFQDGSSHTLTVTAVQGGYESAPRTSGWNIDLSAPDTTILDGPQDGTTAPAPLHWKVRPSDASGVLCTIDGVEVAEEFPLCYGANYDAAAREWDAPADLCSGAHVYGFAAIDIARNVDPSPARRTVTTTGGTPCAKPDVTGAATIGQAPAGAWITADLDGHGAGTTYRVEYGPTAGYGRSTPETDFGYGLDGVYEQVDFLSPSTTYHARIVARNPSGETASDDVVFTTPAATGTPPTVSLGAPVGVGQTSAGLRGEVTWVSSDPDDEYRARFEYGLTSAYGRVTPTRIHRTATGVVHRETVTGLEPSTTYHYRIVAATDDGLAVSEDRTFTTAAVPVDNPPAPPAPEPERPAPVDTTPPRVTPSGLNGVKLGKAGTVGFSLRPNENATATLRGSVRLPGGRTIPFLTKTLKLKAGKKAEIVLKLSKKNAQRLRKALHGRKLSAKVTVTLRDAKGNRTTRKLTIKLKR